MYLETKSSLGTQMKEFEFSLRLISRRLSHKKRVSFMLTWIVISSIVHRIHSMCMYILNWHSYTGNVDVIWTSKAIYKLYWSFCRISCLTLPIVWITGYSFSLTWMENVGGKESELLYRVVSLGTFERVAPEWMREVLMFSISMCPIFFERIARVIKLHR